MSSQTRQPYRRLRGAVVAMLGWRALKYID
jgi:hypothetical protein